MSDEDILLGLKKMVSNDECTCIELDCDPGTCPTCENTEPRNDLDVFVCNNLNAPDQKTS